MANQVTVATPGPAGAVGLTYEGVWTADDVYQVRDCVRYTNGNLYFCNVQHTAATGNNPTLNTTYWSLFINADDAFQWATKAKHTQISDSLGNTGYSALHQAAKAQDWASLTTDAVTNDANASDVGYSAKAWAIGGTEVTSTASRGAAKEWAITTGGKVDGGSGDYSAKEYAIGTTASTGGSAKDWAVYVGGGVRGSTSDHSAKAWAIGGTGVTDTASKGAAKEWAIETSGNVDGTSFSAKEYAQGTQASTGGSAKDYAQKVDGGVSGATSDHSAKAWAVGGTGVTTTSAKGAAKEWATTTGGAVDTSDYSAKEYAIGTTASTGGSAKDWAIYTAGDVRGGSSGDMSAKEWAVGTQGRGVAGEGSAKDWATRAEDSTVDNAGYSALHHAAKASASATAAAASETAANAAADAASVIYDAFHDKYLGEMSDSASQGTNPTTNGTWAKDSSSITVASASNIKVGQVVTGTGIPTSPKPNVISIDGTTVVISQNMAAAGTTVSLTFTGYGIYGDFNGTKDGPALNNDGDALSDGVKYFNTTDDVMRVYDETTSKWKNIQPTAAEQTNIDKLSTGVDGTASTSGSPGTANMALINTVATNVGNVNTVAGVSANVTTVAGISANVTTVAGISANVTTVAGISANVTTVAGISANVTTVAGKDTEIGLLGTSAMATASTGHLALLGTSAMAHASTGHLKVLSDINANITTVAGISANVTTVAGISANVTTVAGISANVTTVAGVSANVTTVANSIADVNRYAEEYKIASSAPGSPSEGDLWYDSTNNVLKFYNGSTWAQLSTPTFNSLTDDSTPQLGGNLDVNGNDIVSASNADIDIQPNGTGDTNIKNPVLGSGATGYGIVPVGGIIAVQSGITGAYSLPSTGAVSTEGWMLCDGAAIPSSQTLSGDTPTLNDARFLQGNTHANVGGTGGDTIPAHTHTGAAHTHTGAAHTHTGPSHTHTGPSHTHTGPSHTHTGPSHTHSKVDHSHNVGTGNQFIYVGSGGHGLHGSPPTACSSNNATGGQTHSGINADGTGATGSAGTGATGSSGTGDTGSSGTGASGSTTPGAGGSTTPGAGGSYGSGTAVLPKYLRVVYLIRVI